MANEQARSTPRACLSIVIRVVMTIAFLMTITKGGTTHAAAFVATQLEQSASIGGVVVAADSKRPARQAVVTLRSSEARVSRTAVADDSGRFAFTDLPGGHFILSASKVGYLDVVYGQRQPGAAGPGSSIALAAGQHLDKIVLGIPKSGALEGTVWDAFGEPAFRTQVRALRYSWRAGEKVLVAAAAATTDDRGLYRITGLPPGQYVAMAVPHDNQAEVLAAELASKAAAAGGSASTQGASADDIKSLMRMAGLGIPERLPDDAVGYAPVYYPSTVLASGASILALGVSQEMSGIDITLQRALLGTVSGVVTASSREARESTQVFLVANDTSASVARNARSGADGRFVFKNVPPGQYSIHARALQPDPGHGPGTRLWGSTDISVSGGPAIDATIALRQGVSITGSIITDASALSSSEVAGLTLTMSSLTPGLRETPIRPLIDESGRFAATNVPLGRYRLSLAGAPRGMLLKSALFGGQDVLDVPLDLTADRNVNGGVLTLTSQLTQLTGVLTDQTAQPTADYTVIVFPSDPRLWPSQSRRIRAIRSAADGRFSLTGLPAGTYRVAVIAEVEAGQWNDPEFLRTLTTSAVID